MSKAPSSLRRRCRVWREGRSGGYANPCRGYGYERGSARTYPYPYPRDTRHVTRAGYPYPWYSLVLKVRLRFGTRDEGTRSQLDGLQIRKTDAVIA